METLSKNKIKWIRSLRLKKNRIVEKLFIVEGEKMVNELIQYWPDNIACICTTSKNLDYEGETYFTDERSMATMSSMSTPQKYLAVAHMPELKSKRNDFILVLDGIQDPGNMGTIIRTADWFKIDRIICSKQTVDIFNSKVVQSSMGSIFRIPVTYEDLKKKLQNTDLPVYGAILNGKSIYDQSISKKGIIVIGNEGNGISNEILDLIHHPISIPRFGQAESLNASVATGIILSEFSK